MFDPGSKDAFASRTRPQNVGIFLTQIVHTIYNALNSPQLFNKRDSKERWGPSSVSRSSTDEQCDSVVIDSADIRLLYWRTIRQSRELMIKTLVLLHFLDQLKNSKGIDSVIELVGKILDSRESIRRRGLVK